jgi:hypothetical protein
VLRVRRHVLIVRMRTLQERVVHMGLRIVPVQFLFPSLHPVAVGINDDRQAIIDDSFTDNQPDVVGEIQFPSDPGERHLAAHKRQCRSPNEWELNFCKMLRAEDK